MHGACHVSGPCLCFTCDCLVRFSLCGWCCCRAKAGSTAQAADPALSAAAQEWRFDNPNWFTKDGPQLVESDAAELRSLARSLPGTTTTNQPAVSAAPASSARPASDASLAAASRKHSALFPEAKQSSQTPSSDAAGPSAAAARDEPAAASGKAGEADKMPGSEAAAVVEFEQQHPAYARGLLDSLLKLEQHGKSWEARAARSGVQGYDGAASDDSDGDQHYSENEDEGEGQQYSRSDQLVPGVTKKCDYTENERLEAVLELLVQGCGCRERTTAMEAALRAVSDAAGNVTVTRISGEPTSATSAALALGSQSQQLLQDVIQSARSWGRLVRPPVYAVPDQRRVTMWLCASENKPQVQNKLAKKPGICASSLPPHGRIVHEVRRC